MKSEVVWLITPLDLPKLPPIKELTALWVICSNYDQLCGRPPLDKKQDRTWQDSSNFAADFAAIQPMLEQFPKDLEKVVPGFRQSFDTVVTEFVALCGAMRKVGRE